MYIVRCFCVGLLNWVLKETESGLTDQGPKNNSKHMKLAPLLLLGLIFLHQAHAAMSVQIPPPEPLDRVKLEQLLKQVDRASISHMLAPLKVERVGMTYVIPGTSNSISIEDKTWLTELTTFLRSVDGTPEHITAAIEIGSIVALYHEDKCLLHTFWADDEKLVFWANDWTVELQVTPEVRTKYLAICAKKRPAVDIQTKETSQSLKIPLPKIHPESLKLKPFNQLPKPSQATDSHGKS